MAFLRSDQARTAPVRVRGPRPTVPELHDAPLDLEPSREPTERLVNLSSRSASEGSIERMPDRLTLLMLSGATPGRVCCIHRIPPEGLVIGRAPFADVRLEDPGVSWQHARIVKRRGALRVEDLGSANGTSVEGRRVRRQRVIRDGSRIRLGKRVMLRLFEHDRIEQSVLSSLYDSAVQDPLTGSCNRRHLDQRLAAEVSYARRHGRALTVLMIDLDHFKQVNDRYGHHVGDAVLKVLVRLYRRMLRPEDLLARYGGEELCVVARGLAARNAMILAERLRRATTATRIRCDGRRVSLTVSIGVASFGPKAPTPEALLRMADAALYEAKQRGRNRCVPG